MRRLILGVLIGAAVLLAAVLLVLRRDDGVKTVPAPVSQPAQHAENAAETPLARPDSGARDPATADARPRDAAARIAITGRVVDTRSQPIAGARVVVAAAELTAGIPLEHLDPARVAWAERVDVTSDSAGRFEILPRAADSVRFGVRAPGFAPHERTLAPDAARELGDVVLADSVVLAGRVVDRTGRPIAGVSIRRLVPDARPEVMLGASGGALAATTASDGTFRVDELAPGPWLLLLRADDRADKLERGVAHGAGEVVSGLEFVLADGAQIRGRVVSAPPGALERAWVSAVPKPPPGPGKLYGGAHIDEELFALAPRGARCAADGSFVVRGLSPIVTYQLAARVDEHDLVSPPASNWVDANAGDSAVEIVWRATRALVFQVVDDATSQPVTQLDVRVGGPSFLTTFSGADEARLPTFADGRVRFEDVLATHAGEPLTVVVAAPGYADLRLADLRAPESGDFDLGVLRLARTAALTVRVVDDASGAPVSGAEVALESSTAGDVLQRARTDAAGHTQLNLADGAATLVVRDAEHAPSYVSVPKSNAQLDVRLRAGGTVVVEVRDALGANAPGLRIRHVDERGVVDVPARGSPRGFTTDARGEVRFAHLAPGAHEFSVDVARSSTGPQLVVVTDGAESHVAFEVLARGRLTGRVTEGGRAVAGANLSFVLADAPGGETVTARANGNGEYSVSSLQLGPYRATITSSGRAMPYSVDAAVLTVQSRFDVDLPRTSLAGRVLRPDGRPVAGACVRAERADAAPADDSALLASVPASRAPCALTRADGSYELVGVVPDAELVVMVEDPGAQPARSKPLRVTAGHSLTGVDVTLLPGAELDVVVARADGSGVRACRVSASSDAGDGTKLVVKGTTGPYGDVRLRGLAPGAWRLRVDEAPGVDAAALPAEVLVQVALDAPNAVKLELR